MSYKHCRHRAALRKLPPREPIGLDRRRSWAGAGPGSGERGLEAFLAAGRACRCLSVHLCKVAQRVTLAHAYTVRLGEHVVSGARDHAAGAASWRSCRTACLRDRRARGTGRAGRVRALGGAACRRIFVLRWLMLTPCAWASVLFLARGAMPRVRSCRTACLRDRRTRNTAEPGVYAPWAAPRVRRVGAFVQGSAACYAG